MSKTFKFFITIIALAAVFVAGAAASPRSASAAAADYTVLEDLQKDGTFNSNAYPEDRSDYSIELIRVAETREGNLAVYIYNPQNDERFDAKMIRLSQTVGDSFAPQDYKLTLVSAYGVFGKYLVEGCTVKADSVRYYNVVSIFRAYIEGIDNSEDGEMLNYITYMPYEVAKCYTATTLNDEVTYAVEQTETVTVTGKYVGYIRYTEGAYLWNTLTDIDRHFVAFSTDYEMDRLCEADITYRSHKYTLGIHGNGAGQRVDFETVQHSPITLYETDEGGNVGGGVFGHKFTWKRIESTSGFLAEFDGYYNFEWTNEADKGLADTQWVLSFAETEVREYASGLFSTVREATKVDEVSILRLKFVVDGQTYNLGVVDNYQGNGSYDPSGGNDVPDWLKNIIVTLLILAAAVALIVIAAVFAPWILTAIIQILIALLKGVWWIISLPFKGIATLVRGRKTKVFKQKK